MNFFKLIISNFLAVAILSSPFWGAATIAVTFKYFSCSAKYKDFSPEYSVLGGCRIKPHGYDFYIPAGSYRFFGETK